MHNLNVNVAGTAASPASGLLLAESGGTTPRTPEILNSLIAMTNPLDNYQFGDDAPKIVSDVPAAGSNTSTSSDSNSSSSSQVGSPVGNNPPSVQHTCSQLIKAGLKLTIEQKLKQNVLQHQQYQQLQAGMSDDGDDFLDLDNVGRKRLKRSECSESEEDRIKREPTGLTPEDEERRRRRRERNKIAATKCRLKKRERTANLIQESETLETQNVDLKNQVQELKNQERMLHDVLSSHRPQCQHSIGPVTKESLYKLPPVSSVIEQHSYNSRPASVSPLYRNQNPEIYSRPNQITVTSHQQLTYTRSTLNFSKPPSIIIEQMDDYESQEFINLDSINPYYASSPCNYMGAGQGYGNSQGMDNGCVA